MGPGCGTFACSQGRTSSPSDASAISVTQLQRLPSGLHHVPRCEAFHSSTARKLPFGGPFPKPRCSSLRLLPPVHFLTSARAAAGICASCAPRGRGLPCRAWCNTGQGNCHLSERRPARLHAKVLMQDKESVKRNLFQSEGYEFVVPPIERGPFLAKAGFKPVLRASQRH